jgi:hypothetical protein
MVFNATFNNISVISWWQVLSVKETGIPIKFIQVSNFHITKMSLNPAHSEVYTIQLYVIKFVSDLQQVGGFLQVFRFPPPLKLKVHPFGMFLLLYTFRPVHVVTSIRQSPVLKGHPSLVLS